MPPTASAGARATIDAAATIPQLPRPVVVGGLVVGVAAVSSAAVLIRLAEAHPLAIAYWRCLGGAAALAPFALRARRGAPRLDRAQRWQITGAGLFLALHFALWIGSLELTTVASSVTLVTTAPLFVGIGATLLLDEAPARSTWLGMAITVAGALTIGLADLSDVTLGRRALFGDVMALGGAVAVTGYLLAGRAARRRLPLTVYATGVYAVGAAALLAASMAAGVQLGGYDRGTWLALAALIVGPQLLGHTVFNGLLSTVTATVLSVVVLAEPVGATLLAWLVLGELPAGLFWVGAPMILAGVWVATSRWDART
ncbi:MAG TPA: DMT family transporter [Nitriliruptorales bacterium]|nr:DMT family transporter [Nitriliruptorales bacterium]